MGNQTRKQFETNIASENQHTQHAKTNLVAFGGEPLLTAGGQYIFSTKHRKTHQQTPYALSDWIHTRPNLDSCL
ncbi:MAG: hypothetical protein H6R05_1622 [Burkholderiaceae bacterium]|nr:hypothetical protein [Burkholderiaceae bacterium]